MNWILWAMAGLNVFYGFWYVSQAGKVRTVSITPHMAAGYMFGSLVGAVILAIAAWRLG